MEHVLEGTDRIHGYDGSASRSITAPVNFYIFIFGASIPHPTLCASYSVAAIG